MDWLGLLSSNLNGYLYKGDTNRESFTNRFSKVLDFESAGFPLPTNPVTVEDIVLKMKSSKKYIKKAEKKQEVMSDEDIDRDAKKTDALRSLMSGRLTEENFELAFPFRNNTDRIIRRLRMFDIYELYKKNGFKRDFFKFLSTLRGIDYIWMMNMFLFLLMLLLLKGGPLLNVLKKNYFLNVFSNDFDTYVNNASLFSSLLKTYPLDNKFKYYFFECGSLVGYRNPPVSDFDQTEAAAKLVQSSVAHGPEGSRSKLNPLFMSKVDSIIGGMKVRQQMNPLSFFSFISENKWSTNGSAELPKVRFSAYEEEMKLKPRKNMVKFFYSSEELYNLCLKYKVEISKVIVKAELGKVRIAVSADFESYLILSWFDYFLNHSYKSIYGSTIEESVLAELSRNIAFLVFLRSKYYGLPFDYAQFDHQPTLDELIYQLSKVFSWIIKLYDPQGDLDMKYWSNKIIVAFSNAELWSFDDDIITKLKVEGGLLSGMRWTSLIGNVWNSSNTSMIADSVKRQYVEINLGFFIRGDDSAIFVDNGYAALSTAVGFKQLNIKGGIGKFSILQNQTEFLRIMYDKYGMHAYPSRTIPAISQSKPWSSTPWTPLNNLINSSESICTVMRRFKMDVDLIIEQQKCLGDSWIRSKVKKLSLHRSILSLPKYYGGFDVLLKVEPVYDQRSAINKLNSFPAGFEMLNQSQDYLDKLKTKLSYLDPTENEVLNFSKNEFFSTLIADDVKDITKKRVEVFLDTKGYKKIHKEVDFRVSFEMNYDISVWVNRLSNLDQESLYQLIRSENPYDVVHIIVEDQKIKRDCAKMNREIPEFSDSSKLYLRQEESKGRTRAESVDLLTGSYASNSLIILPSHLRTPMTNIVLNILKHRRTFSHGSPAYSFYFKEVMLQLVRALWKSTLYQAMYNN